MFESAVSECSKGVAGNSRDAVIQQVIEVNQKEREERHGDRDTEERPNDEG